MKIVGNDPEITPPVKKSRTKGCLVFLAIYFASWGILSVIPTWTGNGNKNVPGYFMVLVLNKDANKLELVQYRYLDNKIKSFEENGTKYSFNIPENDIALANDDLDTYYTVRRMSGEEQEVSLNYELGYLNHPTSKYRVINNSIQPVSFYGRGPNSIFAFFIAIIILVIIDIVRYANILILWIRKKIKSENPGGD